jgi:hypothetical protein
VGLATNLKAWHMPRMPRARFKNREEMTERSASCLAIGEGDLDFIVRKPRLPKDGGPYQFRLDFRTFTASEVTSITGVSPSTQRDWRRRGIERIERPAVGWNRYTFPDLAFFLIVRLLTARGVSASLAAQLANDSFLRVLGLLTARQGAVQFSPPDRNIWTAKTGPIERFVVAAVPEVAPDDREAVEVFGFANFSALNSFFRQSPQAIASVVIDLKRVVDRICDLVPMPLVTVFDETDHSELMDD